MCRRYIRDVAYVEGSRASPLQSAHARTLDRGYSRTTLANTVMHECPRMP